MAKAQPAFKKEADSVYFLKIIIYFVLGTIWVRHGDSLILPAGLILGLLVARHEHFATDRKIEYPILLIASVIGLMGFGIYFAV